MMPYLVALSILYVLVALGAWAVGRWHRARAVTRDAHLGIQAEDALARRAIDTLGVIVWAVDHGQVIRLSIGGALRALRIEPGQLVGTTVGAVPQRGNVGDGADEVSIIRSVFETGERRVCTNRHLGPDGPTYIRTEYAPLVTEAGAVEFVCGIGVDVTDEERRAKRTTDQALDALRGRVGEPLAWRARDA